MFSTCQLKSIRCLLVAILVVAVSACAGNRSRTATSVVEYLYPDSDERMVEPSIPVLTLPTRVGIAFVPGHSSERGGPNWWTGRQAPDAALTEQQKLTLMQEVSGHFKKYEFVKSIELIPSAYLTPRGSFANLDQIRTMYGVDVIALLSYDQVQFTDENFLSITYWTLVGAYVIPGEKNDTHTMLDAVVMDIPSRKMLFRAPGTSHISGKSTPVNLSEQLRKDSAKGFRTAATSMVDNLDDQLALFREKIKEQPDEYKVVHKPGYTGGGSLDILTLVAISAFGLVSALLRRRRHGAT